MPCISIDTFSYCAKELANGPSPALTAQTKTNEMVLKQKSRQHQFLTLVRPDICCLPLQLSQGHRTRLAFIFRGPAGWPSTVTWRPARFLLAEIAFSVAADPPKEAGLKFWLTYPSTDWPKWHAAGWLGSWIAYKATEDNARYETKEEKSLRTS